MRVFPLCACFGRHPPVCVCILAGADIVVGTPGRIEELVNSGKLDLSHVRFVVCVCNGAEFGLTFWGVQIRFFVLDEADGLLTQGHAALVR